MFGFCIAITIVGLFLFITAILCLATDTGPFVLWVTLAIIAGMMMVCGSGFGIGLSETKQNEISSSQEECIEDEYQYNYCPYCGKEIR